MQEQPTEDHIKETAKKIFFAEGRLHAKTQEIADEAGVNRALIHYYFRNRENLFNSVLKEALADSYQETMSIIQSNLDFEEKIKEMISHMMDRLAKYPYMDTFIISEFNKNPDNLTMLKPHDDNEEHKNNFKKEIENYIIEHKLPVIKPEHFVVNIVSMCTYPFIAKSIFKEMLQYDDNLYEQFIAERKEVITKFVLGKK
ncbi:TetR/AcrR family transcriptional regulator [Cytophagaceae bacterium ABcell3]|nr:TetR/AcrR family transcriptional regulator [Cytophagaceae bacterium ABcell3]